jgi:hypothetical protein
MKTLAQFKKELIAERPQLEEMIANDLAELRLSEQLRQLRKDAGFTLLTGVVGRLPDEAGSTLSPSVLP